VARHSVVPGVPMRVPWAHHWVERRRSLELSKAFFEEPLSVALHPSAHSVLVGFVDKLRLFTVLLDDLKCASLRSYVLLCFCIYVSNAAWCKAPMFSMDGLSRGEERTYVFVACAL